MSPLHRKVLDDRTASLLARLAETGAFRAFYLAGGTALALQLGHRFLDRAGIDLRRALDALPRKMPGVDHNVVQLVRSLAYFADAETEPEPRMLVPFEWSEAREFALSRSREFLQGLIEPDPRRS